MKNRSFMKRNVIVSSFVLASLYGPLSFGRSDSTSETVDSVRALLTSRVSPEITDSLQTVLVGLNSQVRENSIPSSYFFKSLLEGATQNVFFTQQYGPLPVIESSMSEGQVIALKKKIEDRSCIEAFEKSSANSNNVESALAFIKNRLVPESDRRRASTRKLTDTEINNSRIFDRALSEVFTAEQRELLGSVHDYEQNGPGIRTLRLTKSANRAESSDLIPFTARTVLSLSMLTSVRTGQDLAFIGAQRCLLDFWTAQEWEFGVRLGDLLSKEKRAAKPLADRYKALLLGKTFGSVTAEADYLKSQLSNIGKVKTFMQERLAGALQANKLLSLLSPAQLDKLIDIFLTLGGPEFKSAGEIEMLSRRAREGGDDPNLDAELIHARQSARDLVSLQLNALKDRSLEAQKQEDLQALKQMR